MEFCAPMIIYALFSLIQIIIDLLGGLYNSAGIKTVISSFVSASLYVLCQKGFLVTSWVIVLVPFLFMAFTTSVLLYQLNLNDSFEKPCDEVSRVETTILNDPRYKHGYTHLYKYTTTPVKMRFEPAKKCEEEEKDYGKNNYFTDSDPSYESFM